MRTKNTGSVSATMSVAVPSGRSNVTAMPRPSTSASGAAGLPLPLEKRTRASIGPPWRWPARLSPAAAGVAVNVAAQSVPLACVARSPSCRP